MASTVDVTSLNSLFADLSFVNNNCNSIDDTVFRSNDVITQRSTSSAARPTLMTSFSVPVDSPFMDVSTWSPEPRAPGSHDRRPTSVSDTLSPSRQTPAAPTRYKTELCRPFEEHGTCRYGAKCQFAHGRAELRAVARHPKYKTDRCRTFHTTGLCPYGPRCHFIHNDEERRAPDGAEGSSTSRQQREELARRRALINSSQGDVSVTSSPTKLHRNLSDRQPRPECQLQRRASNVADAIIRHAVTSSQNQLQPLAETDFMGPERQGKSLGSTAESFSSASSITDSPSPSPTSGLQVGAAATLTEDMTSPVLPIGAAMEDERARAMLAEWVSRLPPNDLSSLLRFLCTQQPNFAQSTSHDSHSAPWKQDMWSQHHYYHQQQQQQQSAHQRSSPVEPASNYCW